MSRTLNLIVVLIMTTVSNSTSLSAQTNTSSTARVVASILNVEKVHLGSTMRVKTAGKTSEGKVSEIRGDSLWLLSRGNRVGISVSTVDSAWTLERRWGKGAMIGAISGGVLLGALVGLAYQGFCESKVCPVSEAVGPALLGGVIGAAYGMAIGAGTGWLVKGWKRRLP